MIAWIQAPLEFPGAHSTLQPSGAQSALIVGRLWDPMYAGAVATFLLVVAALLLALFRRRPVTDALEDPGRERRMGWTVGVATGLTVLVLFTCLVLDISVGRALSANPGEHAIQIRVTGHQWWWSCARPT